MAFVVVNMEIVNSVLSVVLLILTFVNYHQIKKRQILTERLTLSLHKECIELDSLIHTAKNVSDVQDNFNWTAIMILARHIHDLEKFNARK